MAQEGVMLQIEYHDEKVRKIMCDAKVFQKKVNLDIAKSIKRRMNQLEATDNFNEYLTKVALGKPHPLEGNLKGCFAISISPNYRLIIEPLETKLDMESLKKCRKINIKGVLEYHGGKNEWLIP